MRFYGWFDEPYPFVQCEFHVLEPLTHVTWRCARCGAQFIEEGEL